MRMSSCPVLILALALSATPAAAQQASLTRPDEADTATAAGESRQAPVPPLRLRPARPAALPVLYVGYGLLQGVDLWQTARLVNGGAREVNPVMAGAAGHSAAMIAVKAATTAGTLYFVERLWKDDHRIAAIVTMVAVTGVSAAVVAHNAGHLDRR